MKKEEFLAEVKGLEERFMMYPPWSLSFECESAGDFVIGYFYDAEDGCWKAYENLDRGSHRIVLKTKNEEEVYDQVISTIEGKIIENEAYYAFMKWQREQKEQDDS